MSEQNCGENNANSQLCCPLSSAPDPGDCTWRGGEIGMYCNGHCHEDEVMLMMNKWGNGGHTCYDGNKAFCCKSPLAAENKCRWTGMGRNCDAGETTMVSDLICISVVTGHRRMADMGACPDIRGINSLRHCRCRLRHTTYCRYRVSHS